MNSITIPAGATLSGLALSSGLSVNDIMDANKGNTSAIPDQNNPNLIIEGKTLNMPAKSSVIQTTTSQRAQTQDRQANLANITTNNAATTAALNTPADTTGTGAGKGGAPADGSGGAAGNGDNAGSAFDSLTGQPAGAVGFTTDAEGNRSWVGQDGKPLAGSNDPLTAIKGRVADIRSNGQLQIKNMTTTLKGLMALSSSQGQANIQRLLDLYGQRIRNTEESFQRLGSAKNTADFRNGINRYTPEQGAGIMTDNEVREQVAVSNLITKMNDAITKAQTAQNQNDTRNFNLEYSKIESFQKEIDSSISNLMKEATTYQNNQTKAAQAATKETHDHIKTSMEESKRVAPALASSITSSGITDKKKRQAFIEKYAKENGLDPAVLSGDVQAYLDKSTKPGGKKGASGSTDNPFKSGGLSYTSDDLGNMEAAFTKGASVDGKTYVARNANGYVDPGLYKVMADKWRSAGGLIKDFIAKFPPAQYIDPTATSTLPSYLSPKAKTSTDGTINALGS